MDLFFILFLIFLSIVGIVLEEIILLYEIKDSKAPGMLIEASNGALHIFSKGIGKTTLVFTSGTGSASPYYDFYNLQESVSKFTKTALYERYGYGYSNDLSHGIPLDSLVDDIRFALKKSGHTPPYIFLAHSMASIEVLRYTQMYPNEVMGIILEDGVNPEIKDTIPIPNTLTLRSIQFLKFIGLLRLAFKIPFFKNQVITASASKEIIKIKTRLTIKNFWNENMVCEMKNFKRNCSTVLSHGTNFKDLPIQILTAENRRAYSDSVNKIWLQSQKNMRHFSTNTDQIIVEGSDHFIHDDNNDIIISAIKSILH